jgi:tetratricopeptide (TPR) repeat protein
MAEPARRNAPCPCGSGLRYKECHGRIEAAPPGPEALVQPALEAHRAGRIEEAERAYREILERQPGHAVATHYLALILWQRGDVARAEAGLRASLAADPTVADFHNNLGLLLRDTGRADAAAEAFRSALRIDPGWAEAHSNLGLALEAAGDWDAAIAAHREAVARAPAFAAGRQNLARALLTRGDLGEAWGAYRWRLVARGAASAPPPERAPRLPASLAGRRLALIAEQGLGDILFFLRFAPALVERGAALAFRGDARLHAMLGRTGLFALGLEDLEAPTRELERIAIGDLPWELDRDQAPPLRFAADVTRVTRLREAIAVDRGSPLVALTWRGGLASQGPSTTQVKAIDPKLLGSVLARPGLRWISIQRLPHPGEREALEHALGSPVLDLSAANDDLEEMLALLCLVTGYVGVSNANTHLRAGLGKPMDVLVAHPPEWRWGLRAASPWFPEARLHRQAASGEWHLEALRAGPLGAG